jgi:hypothetical protein
MSKRLTSIALITFGLIAQLPSPVQAQQQQQQSTFFQRVIVTRQPRFLINGVSINQNLRYEVVSRLEVTPSQQQSVLAVRQSVVSAKLIAADPLSQATYTQALNRLIGTTFHYQLNDQNKVISFRGGKSSREVKSVKALEGKGFLMTSLIDDDGWKELASLTFFQPPPQKQRWVDQMFHDWSPLGSWTGETSYTSGRKRGKRQLYSYQHSMKYQAPKESTKRAVSALPFSLDGAEFRSIKSGGQITYDIAKARVESVEELFHVQGVVAATVLGQAARIQLEEKQAFSIQIQDQNAWRQ